MKTLFNIIGIIVKITMILMAIVGTIMSIYMLMIGKAYVHNVYDVVDEYWDSFNPDDEAQDMAITSEAVSRTLADPKLNSNRFVNVVSHSVNRIASFVANL